MGRKGSHLSNDTRDAVCKLFTSGNNVSSISKMLAVPRTTNSAIIQTFKRTGNVKKKSMSGRKEKLSVRAQRLLSRIIAANRKKPIAVVMAEFNNQSDTPISKTTFFRYCKKLRFKRRIYGKKLALGHRHRKLRLQWVRVRRGLSVEEYWKKVVFSDECTVKVGQNHRIFVWKKDGEGSHRPDIYGIPHPSTTTRYTVNIWSCITWHGQGPIKVIDGKVDAKKYMDILDECLWPSMSNFFPDSNFLFQEDNAPIHKARIVKEYFRNHHVSPISWPAYSPDLNPIENCWAYLKRMLQKEIHLIKSEQDIRDKVKEIWGQLPLSYFRGLYDSMPRRCRQVHLLKGHLCKY